MTIAVIDRDAQKTVQVDPGEATRGITSGQYAPTTERVRVGRGDRTGTLAVHELPAALADGWELIDAEEARARTIRREESDLASTVLGAVEAAGSGATLGVLPLAERALGVPAERLRARRGHLGLAGEALELAGAVTPLGLSPAGLATRAAARVGRAVGSVAPRAMAVAARGATEGLAFGAGAALDESVISDRAITAEHLLASGVMGAILGGAADTVVSVGLPAIGRGTRALSRRAAGKLAERITGSKGGRFAEAIATAQATLTGASRTDAALLWKKVLSRDKTTRMALQDRVQVTADAAAGIRDVVESFKVVNVALRKAKRSQIKDLAAQMPSDAVDVAVPRTVTELGNVQAKLAEMQAKYGGSAFYQTSLRDAEAAIARAVGKIDEAPKVRPRGKGGRFKQAARAEAHATFDAMDRLKIELDEIRQGLKRHSGTDKIAYDTERAVGDLVAPIREILSDEAVWGKAAAAQKEINAGWSDYLSLIDRRGDTDTTVARMFRGEGDVDPRLALTLARRRPGKDIAGDKAHGDLFRVLDAQEKLESASLRHLDIDSETTKAMEHAATMRAKAVEKLDQKADVYAMADVWDRLRAAEGMSSPSMTAATSLGPAIGGAAGFALGGVPGLALGAVAGGITRPYTTLRTLAGILDVSDRVRGQLSAAVGKFVAKVGSPVPRIARVAAARSAASAAADDERRSESVETFARSPDAAAEMIDRHVYQVSRVAPMLGDVAREKATRAMFALLDRRPPVFVPTVGDPLVDPVAMAAWRRYADVVEDPQAAVRELEAGTLTREHVDALREVYPEILRDIQDRVLEEIVDSPPAFERRIHVGLLLDLPTDTSLSAPVLAAAAMAPAAQDESTRGPIRKIDTNADDLDTTVSRAERGGERA